MVSWGQTGGPSLSLGGSPGPQVLVTQDVEHKAGAHCFLGRWGFFKSSSAPDSECSWPLAEWRIIAVPGTILRISANRIFLEFSASI